MNSLLSFSKFGILHAFNFLIITLANPFVVDIYWASLTGKNDVLPGVTW